MLDTVLLAPSGSTGNLTGQPASLHNGNWDIVALQFVVESIASGSVTFKFQGSLDNANWYDVGYITDLSDTISVAPQSLAVAAASVQFISNPVARRYLYYRVVTSNNTNAVFRAEAYRLL